MPSSFAITCRTSCRVKTTGRLLERLRANHARNQTGVDLQHTLIEEQQSAECLILRAGADLAFDGKMRQKLIDLGRAHVDQMALVVKEDVALDPVVVGVFGTDGVMEQATHVPHTIEQFRRLGRRGRSVWFGLKCCTPTALNLEAQLAIGGVEKGMPRKWNGVR